MAMTTGYSLSAPAHEDTMEMSSPGNLGDTDIDIDFDGFAAGPQLTDDERMLEDSDQARPPTATDEMMDDGDHTADTTVVEELMQDDDVVHLYADDDDLIDYADDDIEDQADAMPAGSLVTPAEVAAEESDQVVQELQIQPDVTSDPEQPQIDNAIGSVGAAPVASRTVVGEAQDTTYDVHDDGNVVTVEETGLPDDSAHHVGDNTVSNNIEQHPHEDDEYAEGYDEDDDYHENEVDPLLDQPAVLDTSVNSALEEAPGTPTDTGLHPITVYFYDLSMPLFKSRAQPDGLLKDDNLASVSLAELIQSSRQRLAVKTGEVILEDSNLCLNFHQLELEFEEDDRSTFEISLNDILEVFLQLHQNSGHGDVPSLSLEFRTRYKSSTVLQFLKQAASEGQGIEDLSSITKSHGYEFTEEDAAENTVLENSDHTNGQPEADLAHAEVRTHNDEGDEQEYQYADQEYYGEPDNQQDYEESEGQEYHDGILEEDERVEGGSEAHAVAKDPAKPISHDGEDETFDQTGSTLDNQGPAADQEPPPARNVVKSASTSSSQTVYGDQLDATTGEYDEDVIDWDSDSLIGDGSEPGQTKYDFDDDNDFANFLEDTATEEAQQNIEPAEAMTPAPNTAASAGHSPHPQAVSDLGQDQSAAMSGNSIEFNGAALDNVLKATGQDVDGVDNEAYDQTDLLEYDDDDDAPVEDDEDFHTAHDLFADDAQAPGYKHEATTTAGNPDANKSDELTYHNEDDIGYDDDDDVPGNQQTASQPLVKSNSPLGKRSYEEHAELDEIDFDEPDLKKARAG